MARLNERKIEKLIQENVGIVVEVNLFIQEKNVLISFMSEESEAELSTAIDYAIQHLSMVKQSEQSVEVGGTVWHFAYLRLKS